MQGNNNDLISKVRTIIKVSITAAFFVLLLTSALRLNQLCIDFMMQYFDIYFMLIGTTIFLVLLILTVTDLGMQSFYPWVVVEYISSGGFKKMNKLKKFAWIGITFIFIIQITMSTILTNQTTDTIAIGTLGDQPNGDQLANTTNNLVASFEDSKKELKAGIKELEYLVSNAPAAGAALVTTAIASKGHEMKRLYERPGDIWAHQQLAGSIRDARRDSTTLSKERADILAISRTDYRDFLKNNDPSKSTAVMTISSTTTTKLKNWQSKASSRSGFLQIVFAICILMVICLVPIDVALTKLQGEDPANVRKQMSLLQLVLLAVGTPYNAVINYADSKLSNLSFAGASGQIPPTQNNDKDSNDTKRKDLSGQHLHSDNDNDKTSDDSKKPTVIMQNNIPVFAHKKADDTWAYMTKSQVSSYMSKYNQRVADTRERLAEHPTNEKIKQALDNRLLNLEYWSDAYDEIIGVEAINANTQAQE